MATITLGVGDQTHAYTRSGGGSNDTLADFGSIHFAATINGANERPSPTPSSATGTATGVLNKAQTRLELDFVINGLDLDGAQTADPDDDVQGFHLHRGPATGTGTVVFGLFPNHDLNGDRVIDAANGTASTAWDANEGNGTTLSAELNNLLTDNIYVNLHTDPFPAGEIRGQLLKQDSGEDRISLAGANIGDFASLQAFMTEVSGDTVIATVLNGQTYRLVLDGVGLSHLDASDFVFAGAVNQTITGGALVDHLFGAGGADVINGGGANDRLFGEAGNDRLKGSTGNDILNGGAGTDTADFSDKTASVVLFLKGAAATTAKVGGVNEDTVRLVENAIGGSCADQLVGADGLANVLSGGGGNDILSGFAGNDILQGQQNDDTLTGGLGADTLGMELGNDTAVYGALADSGIGAGLRDILQGFGAGDRIDVSAIDAQAGVTGNQAFVLEDGDGVFERGEIKQTISGGSLILDFNADTDTTSEMQLFLSGRTTLLAAGDFVP